MTRAMFFPMLASLATEESTGGSAPYSAVVTAIGQLVVTIAFVGAATFLLVTNQPVPEELWTLAVAITAAYVTQRVPVVSGRR